MKEASASALPTADEPCANQCSMDCSSERVEVMNKVIVAGWGADLNRGVGQGEGDGVTAVVAEEKAVPIDCEVQCGGTSECGSERGGGVDGEDGKRAESV